jgi:hypothetical protein
MKTASIGILHELAGLVDDANIIGSRESGELIRKKIKQKLDAGCQTVTLEFHGVEDVTQSFVDEVIGIFTRAYGVDFIKEHFRLNNANSSIRSTFNFVIAYSREKIA